MLLFQAGERYLLSCKARTTLGATLGSTNGERYLSAGSTARRVVPVGGRRLACTRRSNGVRQPNSFGAEAVPMFFRHHILPHPEQCLHPHRMVTFSTLPQDQPLPDASCELAGVDGGLGLLLLEHILSVLVELERLLPPLLLHQQDH